jgi:O-methyltransferase
LNTYKQTKYRRKLLYAGYSVMNRVLGMFTRPKSVPPLRLTIETQFYDRKVTDISYPDHVRLLALDMAGNEICSRKIAGSVAEVGVFQGDFAKYINQVFSDRTFYLFDTFEGFDDRDLKKDESEGYYSLDQDFSLTNVEHVLSKMEFRENCVVKKGYFPESLGGLEETFCFVSLDTDLYNPILEGLEYFYPRLSPGGYIFVHDYNNSPYEGVKQAINEFRDKTGVSFFPLPDWGGTMVIIKPERQQ